MSWEHHFKVASRKVFVLQHARERLLSRFRLDWAPKDWRRALRERKEEVRRVAESGDPANVLLDGHIITVIRPRHEKAVSVATVMPRSMMEGRGRTWV
jgi:hypothetical protein